MQNFTRKISWIMGDDIVLVLQTGNMNASEQYESNLVFSDQQDLSFKKYTRVCQVLSPFHHVSCSDLDKILLLISAL